MAPAAPSQQEPTTRKPMPMGREVPVFFGAGVRRQRGTIGTPAIAIRRPRGGE